MLKTHFIPLIRYKLKGLLNVVFKTFDTLRTRQLTQLDESPRSQLHNADIIAWEQDAKSVQIAGDAGGCVDDISAHETF